MIGAWSAPGAYQLGEIYPCTAWTMSMISRGHELITVAADQDGPRVLEYQPPDDLGIIGEVMRVIAHRASPSGSKTPLNQIGRPERGGSHPLQRPSR